MMEQKLNYTQAKRNDMVQAGAYDGRFRQRVIKNKKKEANKRWARQQS